MLESTADWFKAVGVESVDESGVSKSVLLLSDEFLGDIFQGWNIELLVFTVGAMIEAKV